MHMTTISNLMWRYLGVAVALTLMTTLGAGCTRTAQQQPAAVSPAAQKQKIHDSIRNNPNMPADQKEKMLKTLQ
jgi:hypothetical protein